MLVVVTGDLTAASHVIRVLGATTATPINCNKIKDGSTLVPAYRGYP